MKKRVMAIVAVLLFGAVIISKGFAESANNSNVEIIDFPPLTVNYSQSIKELLRLGDYRLFKDVITAETLFTDDEKFDYKKNGRAELNIALVNFKFDQPENNRKVLKRIKKLGFQPADFQELLAFGIEHPEEQLKYTIAALGTIFPSWYGNKGYECAAILFSVKPERYFTFDPKAINPPP